MVVINVGLSNQGLSSSGCVSADAFHVVPSLCITKTNKDVFRRTFLRSRKCSESYCEGRGRGRLHAGVWLELKAAPPPGRAFPSGCYTQATFDTTPPKAPPAVTKRLSIPAGPICSLKPS
jgi:hypothetical protein